MTTTLRLRLRLCWPPLPWRPRCPDRRAGDPARHRACYPRHQRALRPRALIGLFPAVGDIITTALSLFIVHEAYQLGAPSHVIVRMLGNVALDGVFGAVPLVGDAFDVLWRANRRNMRLLREWLERDKQRRP